MKGGHFLFLILYFGDMLSYFGGYVTFSNQEKEIQASEKSSLCGKNCKSFSLLKYWLTEKKMWKVFVEKNKNSKIFCNVANSSSEKKNSMFLIELLYLQMLHIFRCHHSKVKDEIIFSGNL